MRDAQDAQVLSEDRGRRTVRLFDLAHGTHFQMRTDTSRQQRKAGGAGRGDSRDGRLPLYAEGDAA